MLSDRQGNKFFKRWHLKKSVEVAIFWLSLRRFTTIEQIPFRESKLPLSDAEGLSVKYSLEETPGLGRQEAVSEI